MMDSIVIVGLIILVGLTIRYLIIGSPSTKSSSDIFLTEEFKEIIALLNTTSKNVFISGKAGTGKSSLLRYFIKSTRKKFVVVAPTGIAALNVEGRTIHSFFKFPADIIRDNLIAIDYVRAEFFSELDMIIIDEVSMVRADLMNGIDLSLRKNRNKLNLPFGGVQVVMIGDLYQLPPVLTRDDQVNFLRTFPGRYFFHAPVFQSLQYDIKHLTRVFRQDFDQTTFLKALESVRLGRTEYDHMVFLNSRHESKVGVQRDSIFLTAHRKTANQINSQKLSELVSPEFEFVGTLTGEYEKLKELTEEELDSKLPAHYRLKLKKLAQIMMVKNDPSNRWVNGSLGVIAKISNEELWVTIKGNDHKVDREIWKEVERNFDHRTGIIQEKVLASFTQYPIQLGYAMTIHKSQGKTFDKVTIDIGAGAFTHGQVYVALSRCRRIDGITLTQPLRDSDIIVDRTVSQFYNGNIIEEQGRPSRENDVQQTLNQAIQQNRSVILQYRNYNGEISERSVSGLSISNDFGEQGYANAHIKGYCHLRNEERTFKINRIIDAKLS